MCPEFNGSTSGKYNEIDANCTSPVPDGAPAGVFPNQAESIWRALMGSTQRAWDRTNGQLVVGGTANAITLTPSNTSFPTIYKIGELYQFTATAPNTAATTVNINSLGAKNLFKKGATGVVVLTGGEIQTGDQVLISYDGTQFQLLSIAANLSPSSVPVGTVIMYAATTSPSGFLECDGSSVSQSTYANLYALLGTTFGPASGGNFTLPDMRGYFPRGWAHTGSVDSGRAFGSTQTDAIASHTSTSVVTDPGHLHTLPALVPSLAGSSNRNPAAGSNDFISQTNSATTGITVATTYTGATETRPKNIALMFCIKT